MKENVGWHIEEEVLLISYKLFLVRTYVVHEPAQISTNLVCPPSRQPLSYRFEGQQCRTPPSFANCVNSFRYL